MSVSHCQNPEPLPNQVLIQVKFAGLNPLDFKIRAGKLRMIRKLSFPHIMGNEVAGVVCKTGASVSKFRVGDKVYVRLNKAKLGGFAEYVVEDEEIVALVPNSVPLEVSAGIPLAGLTAWQCLKEEAKIEPGQNILIHGGAGSVGRFAIQFAHQMGAAVTATCSSHSRDLVMELGASKIIDYRSENFEESPIKYDFVFDFVGSDTLLRSFKVIKKGGKVISISGTPEPQTARSLGFGYFMQFLFLLLSWKKILRAILSGSRYRFVFMTPDGEMLDQFSKWIDSGNLKVSIDRIFDLDDFERAFDYLESGKARGKVVIQI